MARKRIEDIVIAQNREQGYFPGDAAAHRAASALADRFDGPTIISLTNLLTFISEMGGQGYVVTLRERLTADGRLAQEGEPGEYETAMLRFEYESRDARIVAASPPGEIAGAAVTEFSEAPTRIEVGGEDERMAESDMAAGAEALERAEVEESAPAAS